jgi:amino acid adenylation domain-containing protein
MSHDYLLNHLLARSAERFPDRLAVCCGETKISYSQLDARSNALASALIVNGVRIGDRVGIYMMKSIESIVAIFAVLKAGAVYVPIDWFAPMERISFIVQNCLMKALICSHAGATKIEKEMTESQPLLPLCVVVSSGEVKNIAVKEIAQTMIDSGDLEQSNLKCPLVNSVIDTDLAYILYTSGSTGTPKGVMLSHLNALTFVDMAADFFAITPNDRLVNHAPLHFDLSVFDIYCAVKVGACVVLLTEKETTFAAAAIAAIKKHSITIWNSVPSALIQLVQRVSIKEESALSLRLVLFAGELFPAKFLRRLMIKIPHAEFYNMYGQTEANSSTWYKVPAIPSEDDLPLPIGKPFPNFDVFALDDKGELITKPGTIGELYVRCATIAAGYWNDPQKTSAQFVNNPLKVNERVYKTGDLVTVDENGDYSFKGRNDSMIKCRGYRIDIGEIESVMYGFPSIAEAAVVALPNEDTGNILIRCVIPNEGERISPEELKAFCYKKLPHYMVPVILRVESKFPRTTTGKVDRRNLLKKIMAEANVVTTS